MKNKTAVITGGAGLIGNKIVHALIDFGAKVFIADTDIQKSDFFSSKFKKNKFSYHNIDITSKSSVNALIQEMKNNNEIIDIWINCAYPKTKDWGNKFESISHESWSENVDMHMNGYFLCCQSALEHMKDQGAGSVINMASIYGMVGPDFSIYKETDMTMPAAYAAIKGGIISMTRYLASYYGPYNIRVNSISPGGIFDNQPESFVNNYEMKCPLKRMGTTNDLIGGTIFLASDASQYVTGHNLVIDGGWTSI
ncbi:MAG: SDR family oxidoreductase [Desulfobacterales bacterium]|nr:SDR family oxidoreductase [Desulfobacterales bacterium]